MTANRIQIFLTSWLLLPITQRQNSNLFILTGNIRFSEIDIQISTALTSSSTIPVLRRFVGAFNNMVRDIAREDEIDVILVDMTHSVSATNQCMLMSSDYFIILMLPDFYCYQAIDSLSNVLPGWSEQIWKFKDGARDSLPKSNPRMLGFITQNYRIYTVNDSEEEGDQKQMSKA